MNIHSELLLKQVHPFLAAKIELLAEKLQLENITIVVVQGLRTIAQQDELYAQGRTKPGKIVTNAKGGQSWHNFGLAVDCAIENPDTSIDWNASHPAWKRMEEVGVELGLTSGANWKRFVDAPHFQITAPFPEDKPNEEALKIFSTEGMKSLWNKVVPIVDTLDIDEIKQV